MKEIKISDLVRKFNLEVLAGRGGLERTICTDEIHRPGLEFTGYFNHFTRERIQILGRQEVTYLHTLSHDERTRRIGDIVARHPPCFIITRGQQGLEYFTQHCQKHNVALLRTGQKTTSFVSRMNNYLEKALAKEMNLHGVCLNVFGVGLILRGSSGIGKSEAALALIERGHRLVSDDLVILKRIDPETLVGTHNDNNRELLSLRGIGLIDVTRIYGSGAYQAETKVDLDVLLVPWDEDQEYDALGIDKKAKVYLDVSVRHIKIPVRPGRDIASLIEVACKNWRLQQQGYDPLVVFERRIEAQWSVGSQETE